MRQHYIPQFILRNFADDNKVRFSSSDDKQSRIARVENVFQEWDMYVDETLEDPLGIEKSLARFECDIAPIFKKINETKEKNIWLEMDEYYSLVIFFKATLFQI